MKKTRRPGRPRKFKIKTNENRQGIVNEPLNKNDSENEQNVMEFSYDNPMMLKKIFSLFKSMNVNNINIEFKKENVEITTSDRIKKNIIHVQIHGKELNRYYCEEEFVISIDPQETERIFQSLDEEFNIIHFISKRFSYKHKISIIMYHVMTGSNIIYEININHIDSKSNGIQEMLDKYSEYPIKFTLDGKFFKKYISNASMLTDRISIEKNGLKPLCFHYQSTKGRIDNNWFFTDEDKIYLDSKVKDNELFAASIFISTIKPISSSLISNKLEIAADINNPLMFIARLDKRYSANGNEIDESQSCTIKIMTDLINYSSASNV
jgi:hypothetical protein